MAGKFELLRGMFKNKLLLPDTIAVLGGNPAGNFLSLALHGAEEGNFSLLKAFAKYGLVHSALRIESGRTPMTYAVKHHRGLVPALLNFKFAVDGEDELGDTPLGLAVAAGDLDTVRLLVEADAIVTDAIFGRLVVLEGNASGDQRARVSEIRTILEGGTRLSKMIL